MNSLRECRDSYFRVSDISVRPVTRKPQPPLHHPSTLQQEAGKRLGFSVNTTMSVAQKLYEAGTDHIHAYRLHQSLRRQPFPR